MARIAFLQNKLGRTDGVSLEVDKWRDVLRRMGHEVLYCAGNDDIPGIHVVPELWLEHPAIGRILRNATVALEDYADESELERDILAHAEVIKRKVLDFVETQSVEVLVPNNLLSIGYNVPATIALTEVIEETGLPTILHCHDFWFEEESGEVRPTCDAVRRIFERYAPPVLGNVKYLVINRLAQRSLRERKGIEARVVPNVFDFDQPAWRLDEYNRDFRASCGLRDTDVVVLQATRILDRKAVELAIDVVAELARPERIAALRSRPLHDGRRFGPDDRVVLVCSGYVERFGISGDYHANLAAKAGELGVDVRFVGDRVGHARSQAGGRKTYSLWDSYVSADLVTYPSNWEGWGNQLIEAVFARLPVILFEYPVYRSDLAPAGFDVVSLGSEIAGRDARGLVTVPPARVREAADRAVELLVDRKRRREMTARNFEIAKGRYSYRALEAIVRDLLREIGI